MLLIDFFAMGLDWQKLLSWEPPSGAITASKPAPKELNILSAKS
jgi:hypothetical protein